MVELKCQKCKRQWDYKGQGEYYATCPNCKSSVKVIAPVSDHTQAL